MSGAGDRLGRVLHDSVPDPPGQLDPSAIRASASQHRRRTRLLAPALAAVAVAAVAIGVPLVSNQLPAGQQPVQHGPAVPSPPTGFTANEFRMAPPPELQTGGPPLPRPTCSLRQISATAVTRRTSGGVLGVIGFAGAVVSHRHGFAERCTLPIARGPSALIGPHGQRLRVPLVAGDSTSRPANALAYGALNNGKAIWGFAWLGSYCGAPARALEVPLHASKASLRVPLSRSYGYPGRRFSFWPAVSGVGGWLFWLLQGERHGGAEEVECFALGAGVSAVSEDVRVRPGFCH